MSDKGQGVLVVVALAVGGYFLFTRPGGAGGFLSSLTNPKPATPTLPESPYTAAINALAPVAQNLGNKTVNSLFDSSSDLRQRLQQHGDAWQNLLSRTPIGKFLGTPKPDARKKQAQGFWNAEFALRLDAERFAAKIHALLARSDVEQWQLDSDLSFWIFYRGNPKPFKVETPTTSVNSPLQPRDRQAFAAEPIVRALRSFVQAGRRIGTPFVRHDPPAFDNANPFANPDQTVQGLATREANPLTQIAKAKQIQQALGSTGIKPVAVPVNQQEEAA